MADVLERSDAPAREVVAARSAAGGVWRRLVRRPGFVVPAVGLLLYAALAAAPGAFAGLFGHGDPRACDIGRSRGAPAPGHPFGFDVQGCDLYANVVHGARSSLVVGVVGTVLALAVAVLVGSLAGMGGRFVDSALARLIDVFLGFPFLLGAVVVLNSVRERTPLSVAVVLALFGWPVMARLMRTAVRGVWDEEYVQAARAMGASRWYLVRRHVLPNAISPVLVLASSTVGGVIVAESALTFLGVGLRSPAISWGLQLASAQNAFQSSPHLVLFPSLFLVGAVLLFVALGDVVRDTLNPRG